MAHLLLYQICMSGFIKKDNWFEVMKIFGVKAAVKFIFSRERTFLDFCIKNELI